MRKLSWDSIKCSSDFKKTITNGVKFVTPLFIAFTQENNSDPSRLGIIASRKVGSAINRNRAKRLIRVAFSELKLHGISVVFIVRHSTPDATYEEVLRWMRKWKKSLNSQAIKEVSERVRYMA